MTLEQLRIFVAVAERQHVTRGAKALNLTQSGASAAIAALEAQYRTKLFDRVGRGVSLTDAGVLFLAEARAVLRRAATAERVFVELDGLTRGTLAVEASQTIASYWLPRHLATFQQEHPAVAIKLGIGNTAQVTEAVLQGKAEIGFIEGRIAAPLIDEFVIARDQLIIVVAPDHRWASKAPSLDCLTESEWVLREKGSGTRSVFEEALEAAGVPPSGLRVVLELPSNEAVRGAVEAGLGATAISASVVAASIETGLLHHVRLALPERDFSIIRHAERHLSKAAEAFIAQVGGASGGTAHPSRKP
jgi:DNA-binding transcriptional LysR family regulator